MGRTRTELIAVIGLIFCAGPPLAHASSLEEGLIARWRMELRVGDIIPDVSGNCHTLAVVPVVDYPTFADNFVIFNDDGVLLAEDSDALDLLGDWTVSFWARPLSNEHDTGNPTNGWIDKVPESGGSGWFVVTDPDIDVVIYGNTTCGVDGGVPLELGLLYLITTTFDSETNTIVIYKNGALEETLKNGTCDPQPNGIPVILGGDLDPDGETPRAHCKGTMADVRIYGRVLLVAEVEELYASGPAGSCPSGSCPADFNCDGSVGAADLAELLGDWGDCPVD